jgi:hypothetical protein
MRWAKANEGGRSPAFWQMLAASIWLVSFLTYSFTLELPNNRPVHRDDLLPLVPLLLDLVDPAAPGPDDSPQAAALRQHSGWRYFPQRFDLFAVAAVILAAAWGIGHLLLRALRTPPTIRALERLVLAMGGGLTCLSLMTLGAGLAGGLSRPLLGAILAVGLGAECTLRWKDRRADLRTEGETGRIPWFWLIGLTPFLLTMLLGAALPSTDFDVNEYHFLGPKEFFQNGRIGFLPHNVYTSFPFHTEMLTLLAMVLRGDWYRGALAGKCVLMTLAPLTGLTLFVAGRRWFGTTAGLMAAFLYLSTPWTCRIATIAYVEGGLSFYLLIALFTLSLAVDWCPGATSESSDRTQTSNPPEGSSPAQIAQAEVWRPFLLLAGLFAGSAMACKYPGVVSVVIPLFAAVLWIGWRRRESDSQIPAKAIDGPRAAGPGGSRFRSARPALEFVLGVFVAIGPWLIKNTVETRNPVYPLLYTLFDGRDWDAELNAKWRNAHSARAFPLFDGDPTKMGLWYSLVDVAARNDWVNPLLFAAAGLTWFSVERRRQTWWLWLFAGYLFITWWLLTHRLDRFWVPMTPVLALLAGTGAAWLCRADQVPKNPPQPLALVWFGRGIWGLCLAVVTVVNLVLVTSALGGYNNFLLDMEIAERDAARITAPEIVLLNERLPAGSKVLAVGDAELFEARFPVIYNTVFDHSIFESWCADETSELPAGERPLRDTAAIRREFVAAGITHVYVNWHEILRYRTSYGYTDFVTPRRFAELVRRGVLGRAWTIPEALMPAEQLDHDPNNPRNRQEVDRFGPELISGSGQAAAFVTYQVFPVAPEKE